MPINPQNAKLNSELADLDEQLKAVDSRRDLSAGQKVLFRSCLGHERQRKCLELETQAQIQVVESCSRDLEEERRQFEWATSPDGSKILEQQEMRRECGKALGGGTRRTYSAFDKVGPKQRAIDRAKAKLSTKEDALRREQTRLSEVQRQLRDLQAQDPEWKTLHGLTDGSIREYSSEPKRITEDDPLSTRRCAVCRHYECHHDEDGCFRDKDGKRLRDPGILNRSALKQTGAECWCPKFIAEFSRAAELIYESGNSEALKQGTEEAIIRGDSRNARRLLDRIIIKTPPAARDLDWIKAVERRIAGIEPTILSPRGGGSTKPGRTLARPPDFVNFAGKLWLDVKRQIGNACVTAEQLNQIAGSLDEQKYVPPAKYLERSCARELNAFNRKNSHSKIGPIQTWCGLVALGDKDHLRGMRRLLSRCAE